MAKKIADSDKMTEIMTKRTMWSHNTIFKKMSNIIKTLFCSQNHLSLNQKNNVQVYSERFGCGL